MRPPSGDVQLSVRREPLRFVEPVRSARGVLAAVDTCIVTIAHGGIVAHGEGQPTAYGGVSLDEVIETLGAQGAQVLGRDLGDPEAVLDRIEAWDAPAAARMALDGAVHDWIGKAAGQPTWKLLGMPRGFGPTVYTISIASPEEAVHAVRNAPPVGAFKVKVGSAEDLAVLVAIRKVTDLPVRVDANESWDLATARDLTPHLRRLDIHLIEQPFPTTAIDDFHRYREVPGRLPVYLDEGCTDAASVVAAASYADGMVVKLSKAGGIRGSRRAMEAARRAGLGVMVSCLCESELGISQAAQLAPLADHVDLDGHLYLLDPPFRGLGLADGRIVLGEGPGLGVVPTG
ncbi:enolase C-terminal domain-like protein [Micromonospora yangpuensis]|uniref:L-alanine-DL-glutamate epimerase n=1 Tax=Micromonospora yangpuensis TaxID=683228 RepID=A0A1C6UKH7_9ACTN|nr:enolase C-terminal domain-like protein [Micromonospora yangpuensis]GGM17170.1 dipeptide epimerase [Micromonospora yangpuensis]SCL54580.1 L-alanine-DL-glutamate epimerase [Micromonospora yangpuensis]